MLTSEDREVLRRALLDAWHDDYSVASVVNAITTAAERIVRAHEAKAEVKAEVKALLEAAEDVAYSVDWSEVPESVEEWLHVRAEEVRRDG